jgi:predicted ABC-class ATPase
MKYADPRASQSHDHAFRELAEFFRELAEFFRELAEFFRELAELARDVPGCVCAATFTTL